MVKGSPFVSLSISPTRGRQRLRRARGPGQDRAHRLPSRRRARHGRRRSRSPTSGLRPVPFFPSRLPEPGLHARLGGGRPARCLLGTAEGPFDPAEVRAVWWRRAPAGGNLAARPGAARARRGRVVGGALRGDPRRGGLLGERPRRRGGGAAQARPARGGAARGAPGAPDAGHERPGPRRGLREGLPRRGHREVASARPPRAASPAVSSPGTAGSRSGSAPGRPSSRSGSTASTCG